MIRRDPERRLLPALGLLAVAGLVVVVEAPNSTARHVGVAITVLASMSELV